METRFEDRWLMSRAFVNHTATCMAMRGHQIIDIDHGYTPEERSGGPSIVLDGVRYPYPDLRTYRNGRFRWVEVKVRVYWRNVRGCPQFLLAAHDYVAYGKINAELQEEVWLLLYCIPHEVSVVASSRGSMPVRCGVYTARIDRLIPKTECQRHGDLMLGFDTGSMHDVAPIFGTDVTGLARIVARQRSTFQLQLLDNEANDEPAIHPLDIRSQPRDAHRTR
jgi:hypothetical protein